MDTHTIGIIAAVLFVACTLIGFDNLILLAIAVPPIIIVIMTFVNGFVFYPIQTMCILFVVLCIITWIVKERRK